MDKNQIPNFVKACIIEVKKGNDDDEMVLEKLEELE